MGSAPASSFSATTSSSAQMAEAVVKLIQPSGPTKIFRAKFLGRGAENPKGARQQAFALVV